MSVSVGPQRKGDLSIELNLVPFIDLLSTLVLFLLVSAVWVEISTIPASVKNASRTPATATPPPEEKKVGIRVTSRAHELTWPAGLGKFAHSVEKKKDGYDLDALAALLQEAGKVAKMTGANLSADEDVDYGVVVQTIDAVKAGGLDAVGLNTF